MGIYLVFKKTFYDMLGLKRNIAIVSLVVLALVLYCSIEWINGLKAEAISSTPTSLTLQTHR